ncbi:M16 family metallopeptidase [Salegentibacter sp. T436]|uniref:M16 family metallopeptidase n=1 Tax=Salegentibacter sp. T436 TaxID=1729720 RepID=UPI00094A824E|nr:insulinase family protein [Salegentibacter sp. T436]APS37442.1 hypothetical protein AO058_00425 [Salegentibacter sp. T436]
MEYSFCHKVFIGIIYCLLLSTSNAQILSSDTLVDTSITYGKLENGLSYYIKPIENGSSEIHLRLIVKAGLRQEVSGEYQFAHLLEHLGFVAGKNISFKKSGKLLDEAGILLEQFNGITKLDNTDYYVNTSSKNSKAIDLTLSFYKDIIWNLEITEKNIGLERLTILDEANGNDYNLGQLSHYLQREVTGWGQPVPSDFITHIKTFKPEAIIDFYKKWYHPELMALVVVGDIPNAAKLELKIQKQFSKKSNSDLSIDPESNKSIYLQRDPQFIRKSIKRNANETQSNTVRTSLYFRQQHQRGLTDQRQLKDEIIKNLFVELLNRRFQQKLSDYNTFHTIRSSFLNPPFALKLDIVTENGLNKEILQQPITELNNIEKYGFSPEEFEERKNDLLLSLKNTDTLQVHYWKNEIVKHFVYGNALPSSKISRQIEFLKKLTRARFHSKIQDIIKRQPEDISIAAYSGDLFLKHSEKTIRRWLSHADTSHAKPFAVYKKSKVLIDSAEIASLNKSAVKELDIKIPGAKKYQLKNGLSIILKPLKKSENSKYISSTVRFHGYTLRGINCYPKKDLFSAFNATAILENTGIGTLDKFELRNYLEKNKFKGYVSPYIESNQSGIKGSVSIENLETALQLVYLYFNQPHFNKVAFEDWKTKTKFLSAYKNLTHENFLSAIRKELPYVEFVPQGSELVQGIDQTDLERAEKIYGELFKNANDFTFLVTGDFKENEILDLFRKYFGNLPLKNENIKKCYPNSDKTTIPTEAKSNIFYTRTPLELPLVRIIYPKKIKSMGVNWKERIKIELLRRSLSELLYKSLRFESEKGGTYQIIAGMNFADRRNYHETFIHFSAYPKDVGRLTENAKKVVDELKTTSIESSFLEKLKNVYFQEEETYGNTLNKMYEYENYDRHWLELDKKKEYVQSIDPEDIQQTASEYLNVEPLVFKMVSPAEL